MFLVSHTAEERWIRSWKKKNDEKKTKYRSVRLRDVSHYAFTTYRIARQHCKLRTVFEAFKVGARVDHYTRTIMNFRRTEN